MLAGPYATDDMVPRLLPLACAGASAVSHARPLCRSTSRSAGRCASGRGRRGARGGPIGMPIISKQALVPET